MCVFLDHTVYRLDTTIQVNQNILFDDLCLQRSCWEVIEHLPVIFLLTEKVVTFEFVMSTERKKNSFGSVATEFYFLKREFAVSFNIRIVEY